MRLIPDIASIVDEEWFGVEPKPSEMGFVEAVFHVPARVRASRRNDGGPQFYEERPRYWEVVIAGRHWGIRPIDPMKQELLDMFAVHR